MIDKIKKHYIQERLLSIDKDFLAYEEDFISQEDLETIISLLDPKSNLSTIPNPANSVMLYCLGLTNDFDFEKARCDTIDGSPPDIDIDFDALDRDKAIDWVVEKWGRDNVANIITHGSFKPKSLARGYYRVTEKESKDLGDLLKKIPQPKFGKEATLGEILELNPSIQEETRYSEFLDFSDKLENMTSTFGIHAAGLVISDFPIHDVIPMWKNSKADRITQFDKDETEELGLIKFDFLSIDTLSIIKECASLIEKDTGQKLDVFAIEDFDKAAYDLMGLGLLAGMFQMETSGKAKQLIQDILPRSISEISDISALNRPGPMQAGLDVSYIENKNNQSYDEDMPEVVQEILKDTQYTLIYQEQIMALLNKMAGFTLKEADDARRAMGKKKKEVLEAYKEQFINGSKSNGIDESYSSSLWDDIMGFADYCLAGHTKVWTVEKGFVPIKDIVDQKLPLTVASLQSDGTLVYQKVKQFWSKGIKDCFTYSTKNVSITCTPDHKFLTEEGMVEIETIFKKNLNLKVK